MDSRSGFLRACPHIHMPFEQPWVHVNEKNRFSLPAIPRFTKFHFELFFKKSLLPIRFLFIQTGITNPGFQNARSYNNRHPNQVPVFLLFVFFAINFAKWLFFFSSNSDEFYSHIGDWTSWILFSILLSSINFCVWAFYNAFTMLQSVLIGAAVWLSMSATFIM